MRYLILIAALALLAVPAHAQVTSYYSWEDGGTILDSSGNLVDATNVAGPQIGSQGSTLPDYECPGAQEGTYYLHVAEDPHSGTPQAFIAWVTNLNDGDEVTASFYGYDLTPGASPSQRIWGSYTETGGDINSYSGSAGGNDTYTAGTGWDLVSYTWTFWSDGGLHDGLVIQSRLYSTPSTSDPDHTDFWVDYVCVTSPAHSTQIFPGEGTPVEDSTWATIKALFR
jgi:hypothetical protein